MTTIPFFPRKLYFKKPNEFEVEAKKRLQNEKNQPYDQN